MVGNFETFLGPFMGYIILMPSDHSFIPFLISTPICFFPLGGKALFELFVNLRVFIFFDRIFYAILLLILLIIFENFRERREGVFRETDSWNEKGNFSNFLIPFMWCTTGKPISSNALFMSLGPFCPRGGALFLIWSTVMWYIIWKHCDQLFVVCTFLVSLREVFLTYSSKGVLIMKIM